MRAEAIRMQNVIRIEPRGQLQRLILCAGTCPRNAPIGGVIRSR